MEIKNRNWLITGGCGYIGTNLIQHLAREYPDVKIRVLDNLSVGTKKDLSEVCDVVEVNATELTASLSSQVELVRGDIRDFDTCSKCLKGIDTVVHLAAQVSVPHSVENPIFDMDLNVKGIVNVLEASRLNKVRKFIFASSAAPLGDVPQPVHEERVPRPTSPYGASKLAGEGYCSAYYRTFGVLTVVLRFGNVYGPRSKHKSSIVAKFIKQSLNGEPLEIYGDGTQTRDFIYIDDLVQAVMLSAQSEVGGEIFQIATHKETTVNEIAAQIKEIVERETKRKVEIIHGGARLGDIKKNYSDISKARKMLGFEPKYELRSGLMKTWEYFRKCE